MFASAVMRPADQASAARVGKIVGGASPIRFDDVRAYTLQDGTAIDIVDRETGIIGSSIIDSVSDEFEGVFNQLISIEQEAKP